MPGQSVVLEIRYPCGNARMRLTFESWPQINVEKECPKIQELLQKLRQREKLENYTVHYYYSPSEHLELTDSSLADLPQWVDPNSQKVSVPLRFVPPILLNGADGADGADGVTAYDLWRCLGRGGFGVVFEVSDRVANEVSDRVANTHLALKMSLPDEKSRQSMENEIETLLGLDHPNIIRPLGKCHVLDAEHGRLPAFLMELGKYSVAALETERYKKAAAKAVVKQVAPTLLYLYDKGFGHMDLTPSNILVTKESDCGGELQLEVKLIDAGGAGKLGKHVVTQNTKDYSNPVLFQHKVQLEDRSSHCSQPPVSSCQDWYSLIKTVRELAGSHFITVLNLLDNLSRAKIFGDNEDAVLEGVEFQPLQAQFRTIFSLRRKAFKVDTGPSTLHLSSEFLRKRLAETEGELIMSQEASGSQDIFLKFALLELMTKKRFWHWPEQWPAQWEEPEFVLEAVKEHGCALMFASGQLRNDRQFVAEAVRQRGSALQFVSKDLQSDREIVLEAVRQDGTALQFAAKNLHGDGAIVRAAVQQNGSALQFAFEDLQSDRKVVLEAVRKSGRALQFASKKLQNDRMLVLEAVRQNGSALQFASKVLQSDSLVVEAAVRRLNPSVLEFASKRLLGSADFMRQVVRLNGDAFEFASEALKEDREAVLDVVNERYATLRFASKGLREDRNFILEAVRLNGFAIRFASPEIQNDKEVVQRAIEQRLQPAHPKDLSDLSVLDFAGEDVRNDREVVLQALEVNARAFRFASQNLQGDKEVALKAIRQQGSMLELASESLRSDREVVLEAVRHYGSALQFASENLRSDKEVVLQAVRDNGSSLQFASVDLKADREVVLQAIQHQQSFAEGGNERWWHAERGNDVLQFASQDLQGDTELVLQAAVRNITALTFAPVKLLGNKEFMLRVARSCFFRKALRGERHDIFSRGRFSDRYDPGWNHRGFEHLLMEQLQGFQGEVDFDLLRHFLQHASRDLQDDRDFIQRAADIAKHFATTDLRRGHNERDLVLTAVRLDGLLLEFAPQTWQNHQGHQGVLLEAVRQNGSALQFTSETLRSDREVVLEAVRQNGSALQFASETLWSDRKVVLEAVEQNGFALQFASETLRSDRDVVLEAVRQNGSALQFASETLWSDREVVLEAVRQNGSALQFASEDLLSDRKVVLEAVEQNGFALQFASETLRSDREVVREAVRQNGFALQFASEDLKADRLILYHAYQQNPYSLEFASAEVRRTSKRQPCEIL